MGGKDAKMGKLKQVAIKAKKEMENTKQQVSHNVCKHSMYDVLTTLCSRC
jgi:hypothetical protein